MTTDNHAPDPTPAILSTAHLAEVRARADAPLRPMPDAEERAEYFGQAVSDRAALLAHLDALTPRDREQGGQLVRKVWIAWAKEQPAPKASWLVEWEGLSEPDREVDRRIFETCFAAGRAILAPRSAFHAVESCTCGAAATYCTIDGLDSKPVCAEYPRCKRSIAEQRPPCPGEGWEWDAFALQWHQPGAKGTAIGRAF